MSAFYERSPPSSNNCRKYVGVGVLFSQRRLLVWLAKCSCSRSENVAAGGAGAKKIDKHLLKPFLYCRCWYRNAAADLNQ